MRFNVKLSDLYESDLAAMRDWIADLDVMGLESFEDARFLLEETPDEQILRYVSRHYAGGAACFLQEAI